MRRCWCGLRVTGTMALGDRLRCKVSVSWGEEVLHFSFAPSSLALPSLALVGQRNRITHLPCWPTWGPGRGLQKQVKIYCEAVLRFSQSHAIYSAYCIVILKLSRAACTENTWSAVPITEMQQTPAARTRDAVPHAVCMLYLFPVHQNVGRQLGHVAV